MTVNNRRGTKPNVEEEEAEHTSIIVVLVAHATHSHVEHLHGEHGVTVVLEEKEVPVPQVVGTVELPPATTRVHVVVPDHQLHVPMPVKPAAGLSQLHILWPMAVQHRHKSVRQPLQFGTRSDVAKSKVIIMRWVKGRSLLLYTYLLEEVSKYDTEELGSIELVLRCGRAEPAVTASPHL